MREDTAMADMVSELYFEQHHNHPAMQPAFGQQVRSAGLLGLACQIDFGHNPDDTPAIGSTQYVFADLLSHPARA